MPNEISESTKNVLKKLRGVMGENNKIARITTPPILNKDNGNVLELYNQAPENLNSEIEEETLKHTKEKEEVENESSPLAEVIDPEKIIHNLPPSETNNSFQGNDTPKLQEKEDDIKTTKTNVLELSDNEDKNANVQESDKQDESSSSMLERNWQEVVQDELKDIIEFHGDNEQDNIDLDADFGIDKINNVKSVMNLENDKNIDLKNIVSKESNNIIKESLENDVLLTKSQENKTMNNSQNAFDDDNSLDFDDLDIEKEAINLDLKSKKTKKPADNLLSSKTYNRAKNIIDAFRDQVDNNETSLNQSNSFSKNDSIETFIQNLMKPMLKEWIDENLAQMVEDIVKAEIQKISEKKDN